MSRVKEGMRVEEIRKRKRERKDGRLERMYGWIGKDDIDG